MLVPRSVLRWTCQLTWLRTRPRFLRPRLSCLASRLDRKATYISYMPTLLLRLLLLWIPEKADPSCWVLHWNQCKIWLKNAKCLTRSWTKSWHLQCGKKEKIIIIMIHYSMTSPSSSINIASNSSFLILPFFNFFAILSSFANSSQSSSSSSSSLTAAIFFRSRSSCSSLLRFWRYSLFRSFFSLLSSRRALASRLADHASFDALQQQK